MPSWKLAQSQRGVANKTKLALLVLLAFLLIIILAQAIKFTRTIFSPWTASLKTHKTYIWNADSNINIIIYSKTLSLISYSPQNKKITIIDIPDQIYLDVAHNFGKWQVGSLYSLGGGPLLKDTLSSFFAVPIDGFLDLSKSSFANEEDLINNIRRNPISSFINLAYLSTDLTPYEWIRLQMGLSSVRFDKIKLINLINSHLLEKGKLLDGTEVLTADPQRLDSLVSDFIEPNFQSEHKTIAVFNSTNHPNLAQTAARLITNLGADVIIVSNGENRLNKTQIVGEESKTLQRLKQIFDESGKIELESKQIGSSRAQINIFLGEDYFLKQ